MFRRLFSQYLFPRAKETHLHERARSGWSKPAVWQPAVLQTACTLQPGTTRALHDALVFLLHKKAKLCGKTRPLLPISYDGSICFLLTKLFEIGTTTRLPSCLPGICYPWCQVVFFKGAPGWPEQGAPWHLFHFRSIGWVQAGTLWRKPLAGVRNQVVRAST